MSDPSPKYEARMKKLDEIIAALEEHPAMAEVKASIPSSPNRPDGRSVPSKQNSVYFMWDFVNRCRHMLQQLPPSLKTTDTSPRMKPKVLDDKYMEVVQRCWFAKMLICDTPERLAMMSGEPPGKVPDFGGTIKTSVTELSEMD